MTYKNILTKTEENVAFITINRPSKLNALNKETIEELSDAFQKADKDSEVKAVIITGEGEKAFVAGADISEFANFDIDQGKELSKNGQKILFDVVENLSKPVIAAINGYALGGGLELALACHIRVASENARLGLPEVSLGVIPGYGGTQRLAQIAGKGRAFELISTAEMIDAHEAHRIGLVNHVVKLEDLIAKALEITKKIKKNSPVAISNAIKAINANFQYDVNGYKTEIYAFGRSFGTADFKEGTQAFLEKRKANFPGK
jgi:enoyl-CoA hydratase